MAIIRARYIGRPTHAEGKRLSFFEVNPRDFERLVEELYDRIGYETELTAPGQDGGRDIIATKRDPGKKEHLRVECKQYREPVGVSAARALLGVVSHEKANKGVLVTTSRFTRGAKTLATTNPRLELISGAELVVLMNEHLGAEWPSRIDSHLTASRRRNP